MPMCIILDNITIETIAKTATIVIYYDEKKIYWIKHE